MSDIKTVITGILSNPNILESGNKPLISFETDTSQAPTLDYSLPQKSAFTSYGNVQLDIRRNLELRRFYDAIKNYTLANESSLRETGFYHLFAKMYGRGNDLIEIYHSAIDCLNLFLDPNVSKDQIVFMPEFSGLYDLFCENYEERYYFSITKELPAVFALEEYKTASFLGDYGAGQTVNTFTLLPGEKTTISITTYKEMTELAKSSQNMLDSFSQDSATELENSLQENQKFQESSSSSENDTSSENVTTNKMVSLEIEGSYGCIKGKVNGQKDTNKTTGQANSQLANSSRSANVENLSKSLEKSVEKSNSNRQVTVNTTSDSSSKNTTETSIVRELSNPNSSRVVNYVFRQLLQEYVTITYLNNVKIVRVDNDGTFRVATIQQVDRLFEDIDEGIKHCIFELYKTVENYKSEDKPFLEGIKIKTSSKQGEQGIIQLNDAWGNFVDKKDASGTVIGKYNLSDADYYRKRRGSLDTFKENGGGLEIDIEGVILNVDKFVLKTDSVIVDALLGQGEALDKFNQHISASKVQKLYLENQKEVLALNTIDEISDPVQKAEAYARMYNPPLTVVRN